MVLREKVVLPGGILEVVFGEGHYRLSYRGVEYQDGVRRVNGKRLPYTFRSDPDRFTRVTSVEQMRYDFERDVEAA